MKIIEVRDFSFRYANGSRESLSHAVSYTHLTLPTNSLV